jgi:hypothetical protein
MLRSAITVLGFAVLATASVRADDQPSQTVHFSNGATAVSYYNCGFAELCSRISYEDGSVLSIYSEGAAACEPYVLDFVLSNNAGKTVYEFSRATDGLFVTNGCRRPVATRIALNGGTIHLLVYQNKDETLNLMFSATGK